MRPSLSYETLFVALTSLSVMSGCSKKDSATAAPESKALSSPPAPPSAEQPNAAASPTPTANLAAPQNESNNAVDAGRELSRSKAPLPAATTTNAAPPAPPSKDDTKRGGSAACGAGGCSPDMKKK